MIRWHRVSRNTQEVGNTSSVSERTTNGGGARTRMSLFGRNEMTTSTPSGPRTVYPSSSGAPSSIFGKAKAFPGIIFSCLAKAGMPSKSYHFYCNFINSKTVYMLYQCEKSRYPPGLSGALSAACCFRPAAYRYFANSACPLRPATFTAESPLLLRHPKTLAL